jgi:hypothetical protein
LDNMQFEMDSTIAYFMVADWLIFYTK